MIWTGLLHYAASALSSKSSWAGLTARRLSSLWRGMPTEQPPLRGIYPSKKLKLIWACVRHQHRFLGGGGTLVPYLFIICLDYVLRTSIEKIRENGFELTKKRSRRYPAKTITDADCADDIAILANTPSQAETLLHSLERAAAGIGLHVNAHKTEYMCYNQTGDISTLSRTPLKLVDKFTYLGSSVSSTEKDIDTRLTKAWAAIN